jgi:hypothetical protein
VKTPRATRSSLWACLLLLAAGCSPLHAPINPGAINHVVLVELRNPADAGEFEADCSRLLAPIPSVRTYACGGHHDIGRSTINSDYTVGILVSFEDEAGYRAYLEAPGHVELVDTWKPRWSTITIYDIANPSPSAP